MKKDTRHHQQKNWETEPVLNALTNPKLRPAALPFPEVINTPCDGDNRMSQPRAVFSLPREGEEPLQSRSPLHRRPYGNGSQHFEFPRKNTKVLPQAIAADAADLIISVGTANYPDPAVTHNGTVVLGGNSSLSTTETPDSHADPEHNLIDDRVGTFIASNVAPAVFSLAETVNARLHSVTPGGACKLVPPPSFPAPQPRVKERPPSRQ